MASIFWACSLDIPGQLIVIEPELFGAIGLQGAEVDADCWAAARDEKSKNIANFISAYPLGEAGYGGDSQY
jgi:hypothetical protein